MDNAISITDQQLEVLWDQFADTPVNEEDEIDEDFYIWGKGTDRMDIWHWFDEKHSKGTYYLLYLK